MKKINNLIQELKTNTVSITKSATLLDWQKRFKETSITVAPGQELLYFLIHGLGNTQERVLTIHLKKGSSLKFFGISIGSEKNELKSDIIVIHEDRGSISRVVMKGIFTDESHGILNGTIHITPKAQLSDARLEERVLILSETATAKTIPNLEIEANDVKASHAATISKVSDEEIFYLQTRGITREQAIGSIVKAFLISQLATLPDKELRDRIESGIWNLESRSLTHSPNSRF